MSGVGPENGSLDSDGMKLLPAPAPTPEGETPPPPVKRKRGRPPGIKNKTPVVKFGQAELAAVEMGMTPVAAKRLVAGKNFADFMEGLGIIQTGRAWLALSYEQALKCSTLLTKLAEDTEDAEMKNAYMQTARAFVESMTKTAEICLKSTGKVLRSDDHLNPETFTESFPPGAIVGKAVQININSRNGQT